MKKLIITEEQHRLIFENFSPEELQKIKSMLMSPDEDNVNLGMLMLSGAGYNLGKFIVKHFGVNYEIPDILWEKMSSRELAFVFKNGFRLSTEQFRKFSKSDLNLLKIYVSSAGQIPGLQIYYLDSLPLKNAGLKEMYIKSVITKAISSLKQGGDGYDVFESEELNLFSEEVIYRIGMFGFTMHYITLEWLAEKDVKKMDAYKRGLLRFLESDGVLERFDILKYFDENELMEYVEIKGDSLSSDEMNQLSKEMLRYYLEKRLKQVLDSGERLDNDEERNLDVFKDLDDIYNKYLED